MSSRSQFDKMLEKFIAKDDVAMAYPLLDHPSLSALAHAWPFVEVNVDLPEKLENVPQNERALWSWLWQFCHWDAGELASFSGQSEDVVQLLFPRARDLRIIYPDGRLSPSVHHYLGLRVVEVMNRSVLPTPNSSSDSYH